MVIRGDWCGLLEAKSSLEIFWTPSPPNRCVVCRGIYQLTTSMTGWAALIPLAGIAFHCMGRWNSQSTQGQSCSVSSEMRLEPPASGRNRLLLLVECLGVLPNRVVNGSQFAFFSITSGERSTYTSCGELHVKSVQSTVVVADGGRGDCDPSPFWVLSSA